MSSLSATVNRLIFEGNLEAAERLVDEALARSPADLEAHRSKVRLLLVRNQPEDALRYLEALEGQEPLPLAAARAGLLVTLGRAPEAIAVLEKAAGPLGPSTPAVLLEPWLEALEAVGDLQGALTAARLAETTAPGTVSLATLQRLQQQAVSRTQRRVALSALLDEYALAGEGRPTPELAARLFALFRGKEDAYARQTRFRTGSYGYVPVHEPLRPEIVLGHLEGRETLGIYLLDHASETRLLCLDVDVAKAHLPAYLDGTRTEELDTGLRQVVRTLLDRFAAAGWPLYPEKSGQKGYHLWGFLAAAVPARHVRAVAQAVIGSIALPVGVQIDLFPAQDRLTGKGFGNLVKLPLGIHQATGGRSLFLVPSTLEPHPDPGAYLQQVVALSTDEFRQVIGRLALDRLPAAPTGPAARARIIPLPTQPRVLPPAAARFPAELPERLDQMVRSCALLFHLVAKAREGQPLAEAEAHVLAYLLKPLGEDGEIFFHQLMGLGGAYDPDWGLAKLNAVGPTIISCHKVRQRLAHLGGSIACRCEFHLSPKQYASPLIHAGIIPECEAKVPFGIPSAGQGSESAGGGGTVAGEPARRAMGVVPTDLIAAQEARVEREKRRLDSLRRWLEEVKQRGAGPGSPGSEEGEGVRHGGRSAER
ncbi:MAG: putative helicase [Candidatus Ozemobacter sibiricus]|jgi:hypothetical protein|uniref:Putative helicase n=1 Tax=Candidatus Ozemobacter sibiricus TaxID=2268124 RepID=A0A367ZJM2_9BACT|nr:MAG: putative helicase [Candidatus Ozemobacter sibiricus]